MKAFFKEIIANLSNPMSVEHYSAKLEFQQRVGGYNHGTLWVDTKKMELIASARCRYPF